MLRSGEVFLLYIFYVFVSRVMDVFLGVGGP